MAFSKSSPGGGDGGDTTSSVLIAQTAHGFVIPNVVYLDDGDSLYKLAKSDVLATANAVGVVTKIDTANTFTLTSAGVKDAFGGLVEGDTYYVSDSIAGDITNVEPDISRPILNALSSSEGYIFTDAIDQKGAPDTLYTANGVITENRTVELSNGRNLNITAFDQAVHALSNEEAILALDSNLASLELQQLDGAGGIDSLAGLSISTAGGMVLTDSTDLQGLKYAIDYSATFVDRSLVDKAYSDAPILETVTQAAHGFVVGNPLCKLAGGTYMKAIADTESNATALGVVSKVIDVNTFVITFSGVISGLSGLTPGTLLFVSAVTAGEVTTTQPTISRVVFHAITATTAFVIADDVFVNEGNIYTTDGTINAALRSVAIPNGNKLLVQAFDTAGDGSATLAGFISIDDAATSIQHSQLDGGGSITGSYKIELSESLSMTVTDTIDTKGLVYAADYSANFTARSLVDKAYADSVNTNIFNTSGDISGNRVINGPQGRMLSFNTFDVDNFGNSNEEAFVQVISSQVVFGYLDLDGAGGIDGLSQIAINASSMNIIDSINETGLKYGQDYSANFTDRSLPDKGYTDNPDSLSVSNFIEFSRKASGAADLTSSGETILAVTDSSADRMVTIATADVQGERQFIVKDEGGLAGTNNITVTTATLSVTSVAAGSSGSDFITSTVHDYAIGQVIVHAGFSDGTYNGLFTVTDIVSTTRYEVAAISFNFTDTGTSNIAIDGQSSTTITANYGSLTLYCTDNQVFSVGT